MRQALILLIFTLVHQSSFSQLRYALVIGNGQYGPKLLRNAENDATLISSKLTNCHFKVTSKFNLTQTDFERVIDEFFNKIRNTGCEALFYYSGHGIQQSGENYLIPVNARLSSPADVRNQCIRVQYILDKLEDAKTKINIIILDACRNDPFSKGWSRGENEVGLSNVSITPSQSFIAFATAPNKKASDGDGTNSPYSTALSKYITKPGLTIHQVFQKVVAEVRRQNPEQIPWNNNNLENDFVFIANRDFDTGPLPMDFLVSEDCRLLINNKIIGNFTGGQEFTISDYPEGVYKIRVYNQHDSMMYMDTIYNYDPKNNAADNMMYIPLNNKILNISVLLKPLLDSIKYNMIQIDEGSFTMGSKGGNNDEIPEHKVEMPSFFISKYEVTQRQWTAIMGNNPSANKNCNDCPVENISWNEANDFIRKLNDLTNDHYRLPTEAEWEFAASGAELSSHFMYSGNRKLEKAGWYVNNSSNKSHPVGKKVPNEKGVVDMSGNIAEWCADWYSSTHYSSASLQNPTGPESGKERVIRGGSWDDYDQACRIGSRYKKEPDYKNKTIGFRIAR